jgi:DegV family protein with EDD domain
MGIRIVTDSTCDLSKKLIEENSIDVVPLLVNFGEESFRDGIDISSDEFFKRLKTTEELPVTSQVNPAQFEEVFTRILDGGDEVIGIFISSTLSGTYYSAVIARQSFSEIDQRRIHLFDSRTSTVQLGLIVLEAAKAVREMSDRGKIVSRIIHCINNSKIILMMDTLLYLSKGGRLSPGQAVVGNLLSVKPILTVTDGEITTIEKVRGRKKGFKWIADWMKNRGIRPDLQPFALVHGHDQANLQDLKQELEGLYDENLDFELCIGAVIGTHLGPGCVGIAFID